MTLSLSRTPFIENVSMQMPVQLCTLINIKTGRCPENCRYCSQSAHYKTDIKESKLSNLDFVKEEVQKARAAGATRLCMGAAWRNVPEREMDAVIEMVHEIKSSGMEACATLGMLTGAQAKRLKDAGLDFYNHNIDTSKEFYHNIITTRKFEDRLETIENVRNAGINVCTGGILGMGEGLEDRASMIVTLANLTEHPPSVTMNKLVKIPGTPLANVDDLDDFDFVRTIAVARIVMPKSFVRLSAGRNTMSEAAQSLCFFAGANSIFFGDKLLTTENVQEDTDRKLFKKLGIKGADTRKLLMYIKDLD